MDQFVWNQPTGQVRDITLVYYLVEWLWFFQSYGQQFGPLVFYLFGGLLDSVLGKWKMFYPGNC